MNQNKYRIITGSSLLLGIGLWASFSMRFENADKLSYEPNPASIKGSPYGKVLALAVQGPIDLYWHNGQSHEHAETLNAMHAHQNGETHSHKDASHHDHDHSDHSHEGHDHHAAHTDSSNSCAGCAGCSSKSHDGKSTDDIAEAEVETPTVVSKQKPIHELAKERIKMMEATAHRKTDGSALTPAHRKYLQSVTEDKLRLAYELDPTNYTNYGNLHLFLSATNLGKSAADDNKAVTLARDTLAICKQDPVDPASWITAVSAAYNIVYHIGRYHDQFTIPEAKASLAEFDSCMKKYEELMNDAVESGRIVSVDRLNELNARAKYLLKLRYAQGVYMKRMMSSRLAGTPQAETAH